MAPKSSEARSISSEAEHEPAKENDDKEHIMGDSQEIRSGIATSDVDVNSEDLDRQNLQVQEHEVQHDNSSSADSNGDNSASDTKPGGPGETEPPIVKIVPAVKPESMESVHQPTSDDMSFETNGDVEVAIRNRTATKQERPRIPQSLSRTSIVSVHEVPKGLVRASLVMAGNAIFMAVAEIIIEILVVSGLYPKLPFRLDFFFLTILSGLLGYHAVRGISKGEFDTSMNALQVSALVEIALLAGDAKFMAEESSKYAAAIPTRSAFAVLTAINLILVVYMAIRLLRFHKKRGPLFG